MLKNKLQWEYKNELDINIDWFELNVKPIFAFHFSIHSSVLYAHNYTKEIERLYMLHSLDNKEKENIIYIVMYFIYIVMYHC